MGTPAATLDLGSTRSTLPPPWLLRFFTWLSLQGPVFWPKLRPWREGDGRKKQFQTKPPCCGHNLPNILHLSPIKIFLFMDPPNFHFVHNKIFDIDFWLLLPIKTKLKEIMMAFVYKQNLVYIYSLHLIAKFININQTVFLKPISFF